MADQRRMRAAARLYAVQALFQMEASDSPSDRVRVEFEDHRFGAHYDEGDMEEGDVDLFRRILDDAVTWQNKIDQLTNTALVERWPIKRIDPVLRAIFRAAGAELMTEDVPPKVIIAEYVAVSQAFDPDGKEPKFVNAVLDHMARVTHPGKFA